MIPAFLTAVTFALSAFCGSRAGAAVGAMHAAFWRTLTAFLVLALIACFTGFGWSAPGCLLLIVGGAIGFGLGDLCLFQAYVRIGSRRSMVLCQCLAAPVAAVTEWAVLGTFLTGMQWLVIAMILSGVAVALQTGRENAVTPRVARSGVLFGIGATLGQAWGAVLSRIAFHQNDLAGFELHPASATFLRMVGGVLIVVLFARLRKRRAGECGTVEALKKSGGWLLANGLAGPVIGVSLFQFALMQTPSGIVLAIVALTPLLVMPLSWKFEGDRPTRWSLVGAVLAVTGVILLVLEPGG